MGKVIVSMTLTNWADQVLADRGFIPAVDIRTCTVDNALVDTGTTRLCLPVDVIEKLGLKKIGTIDAQTATGPQVVDVYAGLQINVEGREGRYDCVVLPAGQTPLLGLIPLEDLGLDPDLQNQRLRHLPTTGKETYMTIL
ncbi:aspartyl protease family protein [cf. Phormidesmis sp. LEGE 11477]|uniref:aspartyl protease family protein n=1 Tax=cf. Phormidesmis sp. LEGE 11477 TaxID=1828680 RepID=UPI00188124A9|nr:aspartyl protease family protein [cf. Phormidesmis sp. LEGE 11477]MBE9063111.1 aspartyl protease family protein [cf. Phormidesmis sp. LEGE 11477]